MTNLCKAPGYGQGMKSVKSIMKWNSMGNGWLIISLTIGIILMIKKVYQVKYVN